MEMTRNHWTERCGGITGADAAAIAATQLRLDSLIKPPGSLGGLETLALRLAGATGRVGALLPLRRILVFAADNGVVAQGVSSAPQSVTASQTCNILRGVSGVAVLARSCGAQVEVTDVGVATEVAHPLLVVRRVMPGTHDMTTQPAMSEQQALAAMATGWERVEQAAADGVAVLGLGEMGIGNTTSSTAVLAALLGLSAERLPELTGRGAGLADEGYARKLATIATALTLHRPDPTDPVGVLAKVGGLDLAAMTGAYLAAAYHRIPVVVDGFISVVAALCAVRLAPAAVDYMFASHRSHEPGYSLAARELGLHPYLELDMRLGEGSGCPLLFGLMDAATAVVREMATFAEGNIDAGYLENIDIANAF